MKSMPLHIRILLGMVLGLVWGLIAIHVPKGSWYTLNYISPFGVVFMNLLQVIAIPMIITSLITGIASLNDMNKLGRIGGRTIFIFIITTAMAISIGLIWVNIIQPGDYMPVETREALMAQNREKVAKSTEVAESFTKQPVLQPLIDLFPSNIIKSATDNGNMLQIVILAVIFGIALIMIPKEKSGPVVKLLDGLNEMVMKVVDLIMLIAPLGVFALLANVIVDLAQDDPSRIVGLLSALGMYSLVVIISLLTHMTLVYLSIVKFLAKLNPWWFLKKIRPVQLLAFSTSSSNATLPVNMENCEKEMGVSEEITGFVLPLGATINMDGTSCYQAIAAVFIAQVFNMDLTFVQQLTIILTATLASIGSAGVPGAGVVMLVIVLNSVGVPAEGIALILGVDRILDMCRTAVNVTGDVAVCVTIAKWEGKIKPIE